MLNAKIFGNMFDKNKPTKKTNKQKNQKKPNKQKKQIKLFSMSKNEQLMFTPQVNINWR